MALVKLRVCDVCGSVDRAYEKLATRNWRWLCRDHAPEPEPLPVCERCGRALRPYSSDPRNYPDTLARGRTKPHVLCQSCNVVYNETGTIEKTTELSIPELTQTQINAMMDLLERHNALDLAWMLGITSNKGETND